MFLVQRLVGPSTIAAWIVASSTLLGQSRFEFPDNVEQPIISLAYRGGVYAAQSGDEPVVVLRIYADGRVVSKGVERRHPPPAWKMNALELRELVDELADQWQVLDLDGERIRRDCEAAFDTARVTDVVTTIVHVRSRAGEHTIAVLGSSFFANMLPDHEELSRFRAIESRLRFLASIAEIGGYSELDSIVDAVYAATRAADSTIPKFDRRDVSSADRNEQGQLTVILRRTLPPMDQAPPAHQQAVVVYRRSIEGRESIEQLSPVRK